MIWIQKFDYRLVRSWFGLICAVSGRVLGVFGKREKFGDGSPPRFRDSALLVIFRGYVLRILNCNDGYDSKTRRRYSV